MEKRARRHRAAATPRNGRRLGGACFASPAQLESFSPGILPDGGAFRDGQLPVGALPSRNIGKMSTDHPTLLHGSVYAAGLEKHDPPVAK